MTDKEDKESNILSIDERRKRVKEKHLRSKTPATKADLEVLVDKIISLEEEIDETKNILTRTLRILKELTSSS